MSTLYAALSIFLGTLGVAMLAWSARVLHRVHCRVSDFLDDWNGQSERAGVAGRPGVMERLDRIEHELTVNGGTSVKDTVNEIRAEQAALRNGRQS